MGNGRSDDSRAEWQTGRRASPGARRPRRDEDDPRAPENPRRETAVTPIITLPSVPTPRVGRRTPTPPTSTARRPASRVRDDDAFAADDAWDEAGDDAWPDERPVRITGGAKRQTLAPVHVPPQRTLARLDVAPAPSRRPPPALSRVFIRGRSRPRRGALPAGVWLTSGLAAHKTLTSIVVLAMIVAGLVINTTGVGRAVGALPGDAWRTLSGAGPAPLPTPVPAPDSLSTAHYVAKYGFDWPQGAQALPADERARLAAMLPFALKGAAAYDQRYGASIEPELLVWWTHAEGIGGRINYSNCANYGTRPGTNYFSDIENCPHASFWQLGYGNQFSVIYVLKNAFSDLYGDPSDTKLVQRVGQAVLDFDGRQGTVPTCGGYSCTFPALSIDTIMAGIDQSDGALTSGNWWASVLSRDPAINCYMIAHALTFFNHAATLHWTGCYYYEPCWGNESNRLGDILAAWSGLRAAAGL